MKARAHVPASAAPSMRVDGKLAVVTGAGRGIGRACSLALAEAGADIVAISRSREDLEAVASEVEAFGRRAEAVVCDVTDAAAVRAALESCERIDVLVGSAGANIPEPFLEVPRSISTRCSPSTLRPPSSWRRRRRGGWSKSAKAVRS